MLRGAYYTRAHSLRKGEACSFLVFCGRDNRRENRGKRVSPTPESAKLLDMRMLSLYNTIDVVYLHIRNWSRSPAFKEGGRDLTGSRCDMNRKYLISALVLALAIVLLCATAALAADDPLKVSMELSSKKFSAPTTINVSITVMNVGEGDMPGPVTLYYPSGKQVEEFGAPTLTVGSDKNWTGSWTVTQNELDVGKVSFKIRYPFYDENGELKAKSKTFSVRIVYTGGDPKLSVTRTITPPTAQKDQEVSVVYVIENVGPVDVSNVTIKENSSISNKSGTIDSIPAEGKAQYVFTAKMGTKDLTSNATISYKASGKTYTQKTEAETIKYKDVKLSATLTADKKGGAPGDPVKLTAKLKNSGNVDFINVKLEDAKLGTLFEGVTVKAGETWTDTKEIIVKETQDIQLSVTGEDAAGNTVETATGRVSIIATDPTKRVLLSVEAAADRDTVYKELGTVRFTIQVNNNSAVEVKNITVKAVDTAINTIESIPAGGSVSFTREMAVSMAGTYQFTASCRDELGQTVTFNSNTLPISVSKPTAVPTEVPIATPKAPKYAKVPQSYEDLPEENKIPQWLDQAEPIANQAKWILAGIAGLLFVLLLIGFIRRGVKKSQSNKAMDHLDGANYRDYSSAPKGKKRSEITDNSVSEKKEAEPEEEPENTAQDSELMAETLRRLYKEKDSGKLAEEAPVEEAAEAAGKAAESAAETAEAAAETAQSVSEAVHRRRLKS